MPGNRKKRLFFALWPNKAIRAQLAAAARSWSKQPVPGGNLHLTLHFLGPCTPRQQACCERAAAGLRYSAFDLQLDYLGGWPRKRIQWLGTGRPFEALTQLVDALGGALEACGFESGQRRFVPHITLSRKAAHPVIKPGLPAIDWHIDEFVLAESVGTDNGVQYQVLARWPLL